MQKVVAYSDNFKGPFGDFLDDFIKKDPCEVSYRSARFFNPGQKEPFNIAVVDGDAKNANALCEALKDWGAKVTVSNPNDTEQPNALKKTKQQGDEKHLGQMNAAELAGKAKQLEVGFPEDVKTNAQKAKFLKSVIDEQAKTPPTKDD